MFLNGNVFCFFEQSGTFKNVFRDLGFSAYDLDREDRFGFTDIQIDLFREIDLAYSFAPSIFDLVLPGDLSFAFFPCTHFSVQSDLGVVPYDKSPYSIDQNIERLRLRFEFHSRLLKLYHIFKSRGLRLIIENPWFNSYLQKNFIKPDIIDFDRSKSGDCFLKPTAYWFVNCFPSRGLSFSPSRPMRILDLPSGSIERSLISNEYAFNFISNIVLGRSSGLFYQPDFFS